MMSKEQRGEARLAVVSELMLAFTEASLRKEEPPERCDRCGQTAGPFAPSLRLEIAGDDADVSFEGWLCAVCKAQADGIELAQN